MLLGLKWQLQNKSNAWRQLSYEIMLVLVVAASDMCFFSSYVPCFSFSK